MDLYVSDPRVMTAMAGLLLTVSLLCFAKFLEVVWDLAKDVMGELADFALWYRDWRKGGTCDTDSEVQ